LRLGLAKNNVREEMKSNSRVFVKRFSYRVMDSRGRCLRWSSAVCLALATSKHCLRVTDPTTLWPGRALPLATPAHRLRNLRQGRAHAQRRSRDKMVKVKVLLVEMVVAAAKVLKAVTMEAKCSRRRRRGGTGDSRRARAQSGVATGEDRPPGVRSRSSAAAAHQVVGGLRVTKVKVRLVKAVSRTGMGVAGMTCQAHGRAHKHKRKSERERPRAS